MLRLSRLPTHPCSFGLGLALTLASAGCGARSSVLDEPGGPVPLGSGGTGTTGNAATSTSSGPFAVTAASSGETSSGSSGGSTTIGEGGSSVTVAASSSGSGMTCAVVGTGPLAAACGAYECELGKIGDPSCAACLNQAVLTTCAYEIHRATSAHHCGATNQCAESCGGGDLCSCIASCMDGAPNRCRHRWADAFWCLSGACASACGG